MPLLWFRPLPCPILMEKKVWRKNNSARLLYFDRLRSICAVVRVCIRLKYRLCNQTFRMARRKVLDKCWQAYCYLLAFWIWSQLLESLRRSKDGNGSHRLPGQKKKTKTWMWIDDITDASSMIMATMKAKYRLCRLAPFKHCAPSRKTMKTHFYSADVRRSSISMPIWFFSAGSMEAQTRPYHK